MIEEAQNNDDHDALYASSVFQLLSGTENCYWYINSIRQPWDLRWLNEQEAHKRTLEWSPVLKCRIAQRLVNHTECSAS